MKVLFLSDVSLEHPTSGSENVLNQQARGLARSGMDVYAITRQDKSPSLTVRNIDGVREGAYRAPADEPLKFSICLLNYPSKLYNRFASGNPFDAVISHQPFSCFSLFVRRKIQDVPMLYVFHSPSHEEYRIASENKSFWKTLALAEGRRLIEYFCIKKAQQIVVLSHYMKSKVQGIHGISPDRIKVNPGGVDLDYFKPLLDRNSIKKELKFTSNKIQLFTLRNLEPRMGLDNLLKAVSILKRQKIDAHLILGGEGTEQNRLKNLVLKYGLIDAVTMPGFIPSELLPQYYGAADFFILPTRRLEGFGLVTLESMACGTPVLGTPVGGTKEILSGFAPEFLFSDTSPNAMAAGIQRVVQRYFFDKERYDELRSRCRKYAEENYSWKRHIEQLKYVLEETL